MGTIAEKLEYLDDTREKILTETNRLGVGLTEQDKFRDYAKGLHDGYVDILNNGIDTLYDNMEKVSGSGSDITLQNTDVAPIRSNLEGNTTQEGTPAPDYPQPINVVSGRQEVNVVGKNLFNPTIQEGTYNDAVYTIDEDGKINQSTSDNSGWDSKQKRCFKLEAGTYTIKIFGKDESQRLQLRNLTDNVDIIQTQLGIRTFTLDGTKLVALKTWGPVSTYPISYYIELEKGEITDPTYEQYKGESYLINLGYNLLKTPYYESTKTENGITFTVNDDGSIHIEGTATAKTYFRLRNRDLPLDLNIGERYTIATSGLGTIDSTVWMDIGGQTGNFLGRRSLTSSTIWTGAIAENKDNIPILMITVANGATVNTDIKVWVYKGAYDSSIEYTPYKTPIELCKIGDYQDRIYKENGTWYLHKEIGKVVLDGSESNWAIAQDTTNLFVNNGSTFNGKYLEQNAFSDYFTNIVNSGITGNYQANQILQDNQFSFRYGTKDRIYIKSSVANTVNDFKTWLGTHNTTVYYVLATPTTTEITDSELINQLEELYNAKSNKDVTYISVTSEDLPAILNVIAIKKYE